ncbi:MAG TPA: flagellar basal body rod protein FlgB [Spirochaetia bacterium]|nr:flagellar basal body rod protein FlgB [Spirochaetia bacterium]
MFLGNSFGKTVDVMQRLMDVSVLRQDVIANNIANADTPNFKASYIDFESSLKAALDSEKQRSTFRPWLTNSRDIPFNQSIDYRTVMPRKYLDWQTTTQNNGNNVDIEEQAMLQLNNQLSYTLMSQSVRDMFNNVNIVLR